MEKEFIKYEVPSLHFKINSFKMMPENEYKKIHIHNAVELVYVNYGEIACHINDDRFILSENNAILINSYTVHYIEPVCDANITIIQVDITKFADMLLNKNVGYIDEFIIKAKSKEYYIASGKDELLEIMLKIKDEFYSKREYCDVYIKAYLFQLSAFMYRNGMLIEEKHNKRAELSEIIPAVELINKNFNKKLTLDEICDYVSYNKYHFCRVFKGITGGTVFEYINYVRLRNAEDLICNTNKSISEIAFDCGFASTQYFNRIFKKYTGYFPGKFKKMV